MQIVVGGPTVPAVVDGTGGFVVVVPLSPAWRIDWPEAHAARPKHAPTLNRRALDR